QAESARTHVVDRNGRGDFTTVKAAISAAEAGDPILVWPGGGEGGPGVTQPPAILGGGAGSTTQVRAPETHALVFHAPPPAGSHRAGLGPDAASDGRR